jgi:hypothetical protein
LNFKRLFGRSLGADPERLHFAAHSHHLWPDASFDGQMEAWNDAARLADRKWDKVMDEVWPAAQAEVSAELGTGIPDAIVFAPNTHDLLVRLFAAISSESPVRATASSTARGGSLPVGRRLARRPLSAFRRSPSTASPTVSSPRLNRALTSSSSSAR